MKFNWIYWRKSSYKAISVLIALHALSCNTFAQTPVKLPDRQKPVTKLAPLLRIARQQKAFHSFRVQVNNQVYFKDWIKQQLPAIRIVDVAYSNNIVEVSGVNQQALNRLLNCPWVDFIDVPNRLPKEELAIPATDMAANKITPLHAYIPWLAGEGMGVSVKEKPFDTTDIDFRGRIVDLDTFSETPTVHATTIATLIAGGGNSGTSGKGVAWKAQLAAASFDELMPDNAQHLTENGIFVQNHSYGVGIENYYGLEAQAYDQQTQEYPALLHVFSSGNAGDQASTEGTYAGIANAANLTGQFKMSKNTLSVAATNRFGQVGDQSSRGPAYDGRVKPEIAALGEGGTSEAAALVSGIGLLVQQAYQKENKGLLPPAALVKAAIINGADDIGMPGIDFQSGFGNADALGAVQTILDKRFFTGSLFQGDMQTFTITVPQGIEQLKVTLVWHDAAATPNATRALVNDLDLALVRNVTGQQWLPWVLNHFPHPDSLAQPAIRKADHLNNVEQITLSSPDAGNYELTVKGYAVTTGAQAFSLVYELENGFGWIYPLGGSTLLPEEPMLVRWQWNKLPASGYVEYKSIESSTWQMIEKIDDLTQSYMEWTPPDSFTKGQLRLVTDTFTSISDTFSIVPPLAIQVGYNCTDEAMLYWSKEEGVSQYQLYRLGEAYLEPFMRTADTSVILDKTQLQLPYFAVAPLREGVVGVKSVTIDLSEQDIGCYIISFLPQQLVADTVFFNLSISSVAGLVAVHLERWENGHFQTIQTISPVTDLTMVLADRAPDPGRNEYQVRLQTSKQQPVYSQQEPVYYMRKDDLLIFPNPVASGQDLQIIEGTDQSVTVRVYDNLGRLLYESEESGAVKTIPAGLLKKGIYIMQLQSTNGGRHTKRIIVW